MGFADLRLAPDTLLNSSLKSNPHHFLAGGDQLQVRHPAMTTAFVVEFGVLRSGMRLMAFTLQGVYRYIPLFLSLYMYITYIYIYMCIYIYIHVYLYIYTCISVYVYTHMHMRTYIYIYIYIHTLILCVCAYMSFIQML